MLLKIVKVPAQWWAAGAIKAEICALIQSVHGQSVLQILRIVFFHSNIQVRTMKGKLQKQPVFLGAASIVNFESLLWYWIAKFVIPLTDDFQIQTFQILLNSVLLGSVPWEISDFSVSIRAGRQSTFELLPHENLIWWFDVATLESTVGYGFGYFWRLMDARPTYCYWTLTKLVPCMKVSKELPRLKGTLLH